MSDIPSDEAKGSSSLPDSPGELSYRHPVFEFVPDQISHRSEGLRILDELRKKLLVSVQMLDLIRKDGDEFIVLRIHYADGSFDQHPLDPRHGELSIVEDRNPRTAQAISAHIVDAEKRLVR